MSELTAFIILFRGVGGATQLPTAPLRAALAEAGFEGVATYINSGNAVVASRWGRDETLKKIADICAQQFGFAKAIYAPTLAEWDDLIAKNPFPVVEGKGKDVSAAWLETPAGAANIEKLKAVVADGEGFEVIGNVAYLHAPFGYSTSKLGVNYDKWIGVPNTTRNWNTVLKLRELAARAAAGQAHGGRPSALK